jgi:tRNA threonylcarbamoyladenosine biosynthesis protein TsaB
MNLLAVDTSSGQAGQANQGSLALAREGGECEMVFLPGEWKSTTLHSEIAALLGLHGLRTSDLDGYAVANGPGTFTGLRIGLAAVKALAEVHRKRIVAISTLELLAAAGRDALPASFAGGLAALLDARRGQIFGALFRVEGFNLQAVIPDCVCALKAFLERVRAADCTDVRFCATEPNRFADEITQAGWNETSCLKVDSNLAGTLARIGIERLQQGMGVAPEAAAANYVRASDAELFWKG